MTKATVIIVLGSTNDEHGNISEIGLERLSKGMEVYRQKDNAKLILTGGFGRNFNRSNNPYSFYAKRFMISEGAKEDDILDLVLSKDTIEDAKLSLPLIRKYGPASIIIITSDFHMPRTKYIFGRVFEGYKLFFVATEHKSTDEELTALKSIEEREMNLLLTTGRSSVGSKL